MKLEFVVDRDGYDALKEQLKKHPPALIPLEKAMDLHKKLSHINYTFEGFRGLIGVALGGPKSSAMNMYLDNLQKLLWDMQTALGEMRLPTDLRLADLRHVEP